MKKLLPVLVLAGLASSSMLSSCASSNAEVVSLFLAPNKGACGDEELCMLARKEKGTEFFLIETIGGFRFNWGYDYELRVEVRVERGNSLTAGRVFYVMQDVAEEEPVEPGTTFDLCAAASFFDTLDLSRNMGWLGQEQREFVFTNEQRADIDALQSKGFGMATFAFQEDVDDPLVLVSISLDDDEPCEGPIPEYVPEEPEDEEAE